MFYCLFSVVHGKKLPKLLNANIKVLSDRLASELLTHRSLFFIYKKKKNSYLAFLPA